MRRAGGRNDWGCRQWKEDRKTDGDNDKDQLIRLVSHIS